MAKNEKRSQREPKKIGDSDAKKAKKRAGPKYLQESITLAPGALKGIRIGKKG
ncbi:hypothetical protein [Acuticoccus sediminis]|uniref:hypothetical protein n=1 Tax=Acuticoccus sediminis TaxID=2184697 RepID=UPI0013911B34|nr:hypothetical protein [Acuticoccus sediminis]